MDVTLKAGKALLRDREQGERGDRWFLSLLPHPPVQYIPLRPREIFEKKAPAGNREAVWAFASPKGLAAGLGRLGFASAHESPPVDFRRELAVLTRGLTPRTGYYREFMLYFPMVPGEGYRLFTVPTGRMYRDTIVITFLDPGGRQAAACLVSREFRRRDAFRV
ncbi:MAG: hypothetical protein HYY09_09025 [Firmicutes bacterium]|nr:hypothetical protein [Bacillota bacterium]